MEFRLVVFCKPESRFLDIGELRRVFEELDVFSMSKLAAFWFVFGVFGDGFRGKVEDVLQLMEVQKIIE